MTIAFSGSSEDTLAGKLASVLLFQIRICVAQWGSIGELGGIRAGIREGMRVGIRASSPDTQLAASADVLGS